MLYELLTAQYIFWIVTLHIGVKIVTSVSGEGATSLGLSRAQ